MCLAVLACGVHPEYPLIFAANRDEFFSRPTAPAEIWPGPAQLIAGKDLKGGGTWMGITRTGRFAALTNVRDPRNHDARRKSRGKIVLEFLLGNESPQIFLKRLESEAKDYNPFNILVGNESSLHYLGSANPGLRELTLGIHALSNGALDEPWPKVARAKASLAALLAPSAPPDVSALLGMLSDRQLVNDDAQLPRTGVPIELERQLSPIFIEIPASQYGTCSSAVVLVRRTGQVTFVEVDHRSQPPGTRRDFHFQIAPTPV
jgi:uncharacterized protein with NRDE domain